MGSKSLPAATVEQLRRWDLIKQTGCLCCRMRGLAGAVEIHHLKSGNVRMGHDFTIGLCAWHHRGVGSRANEVVLGPSLAHGSKPFHAEFGSDQELLARQNHIIGWTKDPMRQRRRRRALTKTVPRELRGTA